MEQVLQEPLATQVSRARVALQEQERPVPQALLTALLAPLGLPGKAFQVLLEPPEPPEPQVLQVARVHPEPRPETQELLGKPDLLELPLEKPALLV